jgi:hypothetical protein
VITRIDKTPIIPTITYSTTALTSGAVEATINFNKTGVVIANGNATVVFDENGSWTWKFEDAVGHMGEATATITRIDTMEPEALLVLYTPTETTNGEVVATVVVNRPVVVPEGRTAVDEHSSLLASGTSLVFAQTFTENRT